MKIRPILALVASLWSVTTSTGAVAAPDDWTYEMGWRYVTYKDARGSLSFQIEPMVNGPDLVHLPDGAAWSKRAPAWARRDAQVVVQRLQSIPWHRNVRWMTTERASFLGKALPIPGSLESTQGGRQLEAYRLFHPESNVTHEQAHEVWRTASRRFAEAASGRVTVIASSVDPDTVFGAVDLPALRVNPNVTLDLR